jgi:hypothetical protein
MKAKEIFKGFVIGYSLVGLIFLLYISAFLVLLWRFPLSEDFWFPLIRLYVFFGFIISFFFME